MRAPGRKLPFFVRSFSWRQDCLSALQLARGRGHACVPVTYQVSLAFLLLLPSWTVRLTEKQTKTGCVKGCLWHFMFFSSYEPFEIWSLGTKMSSSDAHCMLAARQLCRGLHLWVSPIASCILKATRRWTERKKGCGKNQPYALFIWGWNVTISISFLVRLWMVCFWAQDVWWFGIRLCSWDGY